MKKTKNVKTKKRKSAKNTEGDHTLYTTYPCISPSPTPLRMDCHGKMKTRKNAKNDRILCSIRPCVSHSPTPLLITDCRGKMKKCKSAKMQKRKSEKMGILVINCHGKMKKCKNAKMQKSDRTLCSAWPPRFCAFALLHFCTFALFALFALFAFFALLQFCVALLHLKIPCPLHYRKTRTTERDEGIGDKESPHLVAHGQNWAQKCPWRLASGPFCLPVLRLALRILEKIFPAVYSSREEGTPTSGSMGILVTNFAHGQPDGCVFCPRCPCRDFFFLAILEWVGNGSVAVGDRFLE